MDRAHRLTRSRRLLAVLLATVFVAAAGVQAWRDAATFDEPVYLSAGVTALLDHDVSINPEHPPLPKALAALPVLLAHPVHPTSPAAAGEHAYSSDFLRAQVSTGRWHRVVFAGRLVPIGEALACAFLIMLLGANLISFAGGVLSATLWLAAPLVLGLGHLDGVDLPFALTTLIFSLALLHWWRGRDRRSLLWLGAAAGATAATQLTGLLLVALAVLVVVHAERTWRRGLGHGSLVLLVAWVTLWASYLVLDPTRLLHPEKGLPSPFTEGIRYLTTNDSTAATGYLLGHVWSGGQWWFWPISLVVKTSIPTLLALGVAPVLWWQLHREQRREARVVLALPAILLTAPLLADPRDIGVRYLLPQFALLLVAAAPVALLRRHRLGRAAVAAGVTGALSIAALSLPHSLSFTTPPFTPAYRAVSNSSVDWGQDLGLLQAWAVGKRPYVWYFGPRGTSVADIPGARELVGVPPDSITGWVAVSATELTTDAAAELAWLRKYCPIGTLGGSILVYDFIASPNSAPGPVQPPRPCP